MFYLIIGYLINQNLTVLQIQKMTDIIYLQQ